MESGSVENEAEHFHLREREIAMSHPPSADSAGPGGVAEHPPGQPSPSSDPDQHRPVDLLSATSLVAASMIGAGVFTTSGFTLADLGTPWLVMAAWTIAGVIAISGALCYGALGTRFAESGGEYLFLSRALHPVAGMMAGWVSLLAGFTGAIAIAATTFAGYLEPLFPASDSILPTIIAIGMVIVAALLHTVGVKPGARAQDAVVILKFMLIAAFVMVALLWWSRQQGVSSAATVDPPAAADSQPWIGFRFATALMWISFSFSGFNAAVYIAGEVQEPRRNVRRAIINGTLLVTIAYMILNAIFVFAPPAEAIVGEQQVATIAAGVIGGVWFEEFVRFVILICLFSSVSANIMSGPRVYAKMADDGFLPAFLSFKNQRPVNAIWLQAILAIVVISISTIQDLLGYLGFTLSVSAALTASMLFFIRREPGSLPWYPLPPILFVGGTLLTATLAAILNPAEALVGLATIAFGAIIYPWYTRRHARTS
jgi:APA family basic amino acid/polyamine antiporter